MTDTRATHGGPLVRFVGVLAAVGIVAAACGGTAAPSPTTPAAAAAPATTAAAAAPAVSAAATAAGDVKLPAPEKTSLKIGQSGVASTGQLVQVMARGLKLYQKYGLSIQWFEFSGGAPAQQALLAGQVDLADNSGGPVIATLATDSPTQIVFVTRDNLTDILYTQKGIKTAADLKGKNVAISSFGSQSHAGALLALKQLGLTDKDVTITTVGNDTARLAALKAGSVAGSMNDGAIEHELAPLGFNSMVKLAEVKGLGGVARTSIVAPPAFQDKYPNTVLAVVAAVLEGATEMRRQPGKAAEFLAAEAKIPLDQAKAQVDAELKQPWSPLDGRCNDEVARFTLQTLLRTNPALATIDPTKYCTNKYLDILKGLGFQKKIGVPGY